MTLSRIPVVPVGLAVVIVALALASSGARAHDSHAPHGSAHNWLPSEGWVFQHWLPFDEQGLRRELGVGGETIRMWLRDDHHTLAMLARRRGVRERVLLDRLTARWRGRVPARRYGQLRIRASAILTQGHLAQHVLFHVFHGPGIPTAAPTIFGVTREAFLAARQAGMSPLQIAAAANGHAEPAVRADVLTLLSATAARGVATRSTTRAEADRVLGRQRRQLHCWLTHPLPKLDMSNPYRDPTGVHHEGHACWQDA